MSTAVYLAEQGKNVEIVQLALLRGHENSGNSIGILYGKLFALGVKLTPMTGFLGINGKTVTLFHAFTNEQRQEDYDTVVLCFYNKASDDLYFGLKGKVKEIRPRRRLPRPTRRAGGRPRGRARGSRAVEPERVYRQHPAACRAAVVARFPEARMNTAGREIFGNIPQGQHPLFYWLAGVWIGNLRTIGVLSRVRRWAHGGIVWRLELAKIPQRIRYFATHVLAQPRLRKQPSSGAMHLLMFWGFLFLFAGTNTVAVEHYGPVSFFHGLFYLVFKVVMNVFGLLMLVGVGMAVYRRYVVRPERIAGSRYGLALAFLGVLGVTGFVVEGFRMAVHGYYGWYDWSPGGAMVASVLHAAWAGQETLTDWHRRVWWFHSVVTFTFIAWIRPTRLLHVITAPLNIFFSPCARKVR